MRWLLFIFLLFASFLLSDAREDSTAVMHNVTVGVRPAYVYSNFQFVESFADNPVYAMMSEHLQYSFSFPSSSEFGRLFPNSYQGIGISFNSFFDHKTIGSPVAIYVFQGAKIAQLTETLSLGYEWNFGASFLWHPNPAVTSRVNAYINAGLLLSWVPLPAWSFSTGVDYTHFSNGHTVMPNVGTNAVGLRFAATRSFGNATQETKVSFLKNRLTEKRFLKRTTLDVILCGALYERPVYHGGKRYNVEGKFGVLSLQVSPMYKLTHYLSVGPSIDLIYDEGLNLTSHVAASIPQENIIKFYRPSFSEQFSAGVSARFEIHAPIFSINMGVGRDLICNGDEQGKFYLIYALKTFVYKSLFLHTGLKYSQASPSHLLLGLGWRL